MSGKLRTILIVVVVLLVAVVAAPFLIPVNQFRPTIESKASAALGRQVQLGSLSLSLLSGSLGADNLSIGDDPKFSSNPFLTAKSLKVGVEILPLILHKTINVTGITIDSPQVTLLRNPAGQWNFSSIGGSSANASTPSAPSGPPPEFSVAKLELKNGSIVIGSTASKKQSTYDNVDVTVTDLSLTTKFPVKVSADLPGGGTFKLDGNVGPLDQTDAILTPLDASLNVSDLNLASTGLLDPSLGLGGILDLDGTISSANGAAETKGTVKLSKALLISGGAPAGVPLTVDFNTNYDLHKNTGVLNRSIIKIGSAAAALAGTYDTSGEQTIVNMKLDAKDMPAKDLEAFLPALGIMIPKGASLEAGTLNADFAMNGPLNRLITTGNTGFFNGKLAGFDLGSKMSGVSALTGLKTGKDLEIEKMTTNLRMAPDGLKADSFDAVIPSLGNLDGAGTVDAKNNLDFKMIATLKGGALGAMSGATSAVGGILGRVSGGSSSTANRGEQVPFMIEGTTSDPKFVPDVKGVAMGMLKGQLGNLTGRGGSSNPSDQQQNSNPLGGLGGLLKHKKSS
jgi:AsmA protein